MLMNLLWRKFCEAEEPAKLAKVYKPISVSNIHLDHFHSTLPWWHHKHTGLLRKTAM